MAINPNAQYPGKVSTPDASYPYGGAQNVTAPGDGTGTPWEASLLNDIFGFQQALLGEAVIVPSGSPETATTSQYLTALKTILVNKTTAQTIAGVKTFSSSPIVPLTPTTTTQAASKGYVDSVALPAASTVEAQTGTDNTKAITPLRLHEAMLAGVAQSWTDVLASRANNVIYTNTTGRPIQISLGIAVGNAQVYNGFEIDGSVLARTNNGGTTGITFQVHLIIPNGSTYRSVSSLVIVTWYELR